MEVTSTKVSVYMKTSLQIPWLTSLPSALTTKKSMKMKFSADKIYYNFSQENSKVTNTLYVKFPQTLGSTLTGPSYPSLFLNTLTPRPKQAR